MRRPSIVDPKFIVSVRKKLDLDQREAADIFGGRVNTFSRYENGKTKPPVALVKLLKVLDRPHEQLAEVRVHTLWGVYCIYPSQGLIFN